MRLLILTLLFSFVAFADCAAPSRPLRDLMRAEWGAEPDELDVSPVYAGKVSLEHVTVTPSCGLRGCDFSLAYAATPGCYLLAGNFFGRAEPRTANDWSEFTVPTRTSPADGPVIKQTARYRFDAAQNTYRSVAE